MKKLLIKRRQITPIRPKEKILLVALEDLGGDMSGSNTLYQLQHKLEKIIRK